MAKRTAEKGKSPERLPSVVVKLRAEEAELLIQVADYYQKSMGPVRYLVRATAPRGIQSKFRFVAEESRLLKLFAEATYQSLQHDPQKSTPVKFTVKALIAFWGRILSSLKSNRSRRRLTEHAIGEREALAEKLASVVIGMYRSNPALIEGELDTRRLPEQQWMREKITSDEEGPVSGGAHERL